MSEITSSEGARPESERAGWSSFGLMWIGQFVSLVGSRITAFAFGVFVFEQTNSASAYTVILLLAGLPGLLLAPFAGALVDRFDRRLVMLVSDVASAVASLLMVLVLAWSGGQLSTGYVYAYVAFGALLQAFLWPAYMSSTTLLMPKRHLARASGLMQLGMASAAVLAPLPAPWLLSSVGVMGIIWIDFVSFLLAALSLLRVRIPRPTAKTPPAGGGGRASLTQDIALGWRFIRERPGLMILLWYFAMINLVFTMGSALVTPMVLSFASRETLSMVSATGSAGFLVGSLVAAATGGPRRRVMTVLSFGLLLGVAFLLAGIKPWPGLIAAALFLGLFGVPLVNTSSQAVWQVKVPAELQGRIFAVRRMIAQFTIPIGQLSAGPLADYVFRPLLVEGGPLAGTVGKVVGVGPGRGIALIYLALAVFPVAISVWGFFHPRLRTLEEELPDAV